MLKEAGHINKGVPTYGDSEPSYAPCQSELVEDLAARRCFDRLRLTVGYVKYLSFLLVAMMAIFITSCADPDRIIDDNTAIANQNWSYGNKVKFDVQIDDPSVAYDLYINMRVTSAYRYSNMFVLIAQNGAAMKKPNMARYELKLATATGEWLGTGSGSMYSYQIPFRKQYRFPAKGRYKFEIEQNMRDNPLRAVSDVGIRVAKSK